MDTETKQVLASICEILHAEILRSVQTDKTVVSTLLTLGNMDASFHEKRQEHLKYAPPPANDLQISDSLSRLRQLIQRLKE